MKRILPLIFVAVLMIVAVAQTSEAFMATTYPNNDDVYFVPYYEFDGYDSMVLTYAADGNTYATALDADGLPSTYYYQMYLSWDGYLSCSEDGQYWFPCN